MENNKFTFNLKHFLLMSKGWYVCSDNNRDNLTLYKRILKLDGYPFVFSIEDVVTIVLQQFEEFNNWSKDNRKHYVSLFDFYLRVRDFQKMYNFKSMDESVIQYVMSQFSNIEAKYLNISKPVYSRKLFKEGLSYGNSKQGMTYKEQNKIVSKIFDKNNKQ